MSCLQLYGHNGDGLRPQNPVLLCFDFAKVRTTYQIFLTDNVCKQTKTGNYAENTSSEETTARIICSLFRVASCNTARVHFSLESKVDLKSFKSGDDFTCKESVIKLYRDCFAEWKRFHLLCKRYYVAFALCHRKSICLSVICL